jgi:hypothetical protein
VAKVLQFYAGAGVERALRKCRSLTRFSTTAGESPASSRKDCNLPRLSLHCISNIRGLEFTEYWGLRLVLECCGCAMLEAPACERRLRVFSCEFRVTCLFELIDPALLLL